MSYKDIWNQELDNLCFYFLGHYDPDVYDIDGVRYDSSWLTKAIKLIIFQNTQLTKNNLINIATKCNASKYKKLGEALLNIINNDLSDADNVKKLADNPNWSNIIDKILKSIKTTVNNSKDNHDYHFVRSLFTAEIENTPKKVKRQDYVSRGRG